MIQAEIKRIKKFVSVQKKEIKAGDVLVIRPQKEELDSSFFAYLISISKEKIMQLVSGSTVYHLYGSDMATFKFVKPSAIEEQVAIADVLTDMNEEILSIENIYPKLIT